MFTSTQSPFLWTFKYVVILLLDGPIKEVNAGHKSDDSATGNNELTTLSVMIIIICVILIIGCLCSILWAFIQWRMKNKAQEKYDIGHKRLVSEQEKVVELEAQLRGIATERKRFALPKTVSRLNERKASAPQNPVISTVKKDSKPMTPMPNK
ncbi:hypothetical protein M3Y94_00925900 [Aphelenchoides besseyi]|nr:hypothetical protein M3Y94_00925900 [Aphelenchoides besseyi]